MRIVSQLVPNGHPISTDIEGARLPGRNIWEKPAWGRPLALGVYPLLAAKNRRLAHVGTALCISKLGFSITALHNLRETLRQLRYDDLLCRTARPPSRSIGMAVFHHQALSGGRLSGRIQPVEFIEEAPSTDVCHMFPQFRSGFPYMPLPMSFAIPRVGSRVVCVGFSNLSLPDMSFSRDDIQCRRADLLEIYEHRFLAVEGRINRIFTQRFATGFIGGPCCTIDAEIETGMTGGPVFSENGYVCGIISGRATDFFGEPASLVSLLYPALVTSVRLGGQIGTVRISSNRRLIDLISQGAVITDGSENFVTIRRAGGKVSLAPEIHEEDARSIYDDFAGFQEGRRATHEDLRHGRNET